MTVEIVRSQLNMQQRCTQFVLIKFLNCQYASVTCLQRYLFVCLDSTLLSGLFVCSDKQWEAESAVLKSYYGYSKRNQRVKLGLGLAWSFYEQGLKEGLRSK